MFFRNNNFNIIEKLEHTVGAGFTLIEIVISIFVLSVALIGIYSAFSITTILTSDTADQFTATYLAQEGMEIVRNIRDTNWLYMDLYLSDPINPQYKWTDGLTTEGIQHSINCATTLCNADYTSSEMGAFNGDYLYIDSNGFYGITSTANKTKFQRRIKIEPVTDIDGTSDHIIMVTVQVSWDKKASILYDGVSAATCNLTSGSSNCIEMKETLYDWYNHNYQ